MLQMLQNVANVANVAKCCKCIECDNGSMHLTGELTITVEYICIMLHSAPTLGFHSLSFCDLYTQVNICNILQHLQHCNISDVANVANVANF